MHRKKKSGSKKQSLEKILLATAILNLICQVIELIQIITKNLR